MSQAQGLVIRSPCRRRRSEERQLQLPQPVTVSSTLQVPIDRPRVTTPVNIGEANLETVLPIALNCLFINTKIFHSRLLRGQFSFKPSDAIAESLRNTWLSQVSGFCRVFPYYTPDHVLEKLNRFLINANSQFAQQLPIDVVTVLNQLFKNLLHLKPFINYNDGSSNFLHQIVLSPTFSPQNSKPTTREILKQSLDFQQLKFQQVPKPALFIAMPLINGSFIHGIDGILPSAHIEIDCEDTDDPVRMNLQAIIYLSENGYHLYIRPKHGESSGLWIKLDKEQNTSVTLFRPSNIVASGTDKEQETGDQVDDDNDDDEGNLSPVLEDISKHHYMSLYYSPQATQAEFQQNSINVISHLLQRLPSIQDET